MRNNVGLWMGCLFLLISGLMFWQSLSLSYYSSLGPGPGLFPRWLSGVFIVLSMIYIMDSLRKSVIRWSDVLPKGRDLRNVAMVPVSLILFLIVLPWTGFIFAGSVLLFVVLIRSYKWTTSIIVSLIANIVLFYAFSNWLDVPLPIGELWERMMADAGI